MAAPRPSWKWGSQWKVRRVEDSQKACLRKNVIILAVLCIEYLGYWEAIPPSLAALFSFSYVLDTYDSTFHGLRNLILFLQKLKLEYIIRMILYLKSHKIDSIDTIFIVRILNGIRQFLNIKIAF